MAQLNHIAYDRMGICNPVSRTAIREMLDRTDLQPGDRAAELGCGNGEMAALLTARGLEVEAFDRDPVLVAMAAARAPGARVLRGEAGALAEAGAPWRLLAVLGTTDLGDFGRLAGWLTAGGWLLWGDLFWRETPTAEARAALGDPDYDTDAGWRARGAAAGLELMASQISSEADWNAYVGALEAAVADWAREEPDHPDRPAIERRAQVLLGGWRSLGREALGFGLYLFRKP